ncbi:putative ubiquitin-like-specific protease 2B [Panicum miliaceum]|uniref:Ubiquitin-like-specific protease 2B n=1 Tax=Panicum miliaceum TaxID=4540 RepID=A0A3L6T2M5_PANMI|nr:putative ubiquitin-like-specific protease 2B [Panicum miliaceum]
MAPVRRIEINWQEVFTSPSSPDREDSVCFASPSSAPQNSRAAAAAKGPRAGGAARASSDDEKQRETPYPTRRFGGLRGELEQRRGPGAVADDGAPRRVTRAAAKRSVARLVLEAAARGPDARSGDANVYNFSQEDEEGEDAGRKYSPYSSGKKNYGVLPIIKRKRQGHLGPRTIPVDKMYSTQPFSKSWNQRRAHAIDPEESDHGKCQQSESFNFSRFTKRRKEQLQESSSVYSRKVQDVVLLDDEDMQTEGEVNYEISDIRNEPKIYYPSRDDPGAVELTSSDINCLDPGAFLSSPVINYYIQKIKRTRLNHEDCRDKFYIFNTYFYGKLEEALGRLGDFSKLRRWWKGVNIFHRAYVILPIHGAAHWSLVIICMPAKDTVSGPIILHLDSLGMHRSAKILSTVGRYLEEEWRHLKKNPSPDTSVSEIIWEDLPSNIHKEKVQVPQQNNAYDCGIFMLYYIEWFIREAPERFTIDNLDMFNCSWFKPEEASGLRLRIRELLLEAFESARLDDAMSEAAASDDSYIGDGIKGGELEADAPSDSSEMVLEFGNTGKSNEGIKVAASEESGNSGKRNEGIKGAESEEASGESGDAGKSLEGYVAESEEESGESGEAGKSVEGINVAEPEEASGESGDAGKSIEVINVAVSDSAREEFGYAGKTKKGIKVAASEGASVECVSTDKSMVSVSDRAPASSSKCVENTAGCALSEAASFSDSMKDEEGTMKADSGSSKTEKEGLIAIVSPKRPRNEGVIPRMPIPDVVCDSCDSDTETRMKIVRVYRRNPHPINLG